MATRLTKDEKFVRDELTKIYPQLLINIRKVCGDGYWRWGSDLLSVAVVFFLEKPLEAQLKTIKEGKLENFITWIANMQLKSSTSYFYTRYRKPLIESREIYPDYNYTRKLTEDSDDYEEAYQCVEKEMLKIPKELREYILALLYKEKTQQEIATELGLSLPNFKIKVNNHLTQIEKKCQHCI